MNRGVVALGLSGGVDSAVCAHLLKQEGYEVIGIFMKNWSDDGICTAKEDWQDVVRVCSKLGIKHFSVNFEQKYKEFVFSYFLDEYRRGRTPNPDVFCNTEIKFKAFLEYATDLDCDFIAMGHYARNEQIDGKFYLKKGLDTSKDQSYFLSRIKESALRKTIFPIGNMKKSEVRELAKKLDLPVAEKKDSTGVCFIGERDFNPFLDEFLNSKEGPILDIDNLDKAPIGTHSGLIHYTIGQRKGLGIGGVGSGEPFFVVDKDLKKNALIVCQGKDHPALFKDRFFVEDVHWIVEEPSFSDISVKIRYRAPDVKATLKKVADEIEIVTKEPLRGITPGQICAFYKGDYCLGSAIIK